MLQFKAAAVALLLLAVVASQACVATAARAARALQQQPITLPNAGWPASDQPAAAAYFPLLSSDLRSSFPNGAYEGMGHNLVWEQDPDFGTVLSCDEARESYVSIPGLQYGQGGELAVAFWARVHPHSGASMDYAYSHSNLLVTNPGLDPNVVAIYLPERDHPDFGLVRAMLHDSTDVRTNGTDPFYLDSNGCVSSSLACATAGSSNLTATDGQWHLLGLTTRPEGGKGFQLYIDGSLVAEAKEGTTYKDSAGFTKMVTGGGPMNLTGNITLCARSDLEPTRFFGGSIAHLLIYNTSLTADQMHLIYEAGRGSSSGLDNSTASPAPAAATAANSTNASTSPTEPVATAKQAAATDIQPAEGCVTACVDNGGRPVCFTAASQMLQCTTSNTSNAAASSGGPQQAATTAADAPATNASTPEPAPAQQPASNDTQGAAQLAGQPLCSQAPIEGKGITTVQACSTGYTCAPLSHQQIATNLGSQLAVGVGNIGVCAYAPHDVMLPSSADVPPAMAFFPLNSQTLQSFPLPEYSGSASGAGVVTDTLFGSALLCSEEDSDLVALDPVQYARSGAFSVNLWFKPHNMSGDSLSYLFSHRGTSPSSSATSNTGWAPNQIQMYLPEEEHPSFGILRTYVKDYDDEPTTVGAQTWIDSDGNIAYNDVRAIPKSASLYEGGWHMATVTSQPNGRKGYRLYIDGQLAGEVAEGRSYTTPEGFPIPIDGGEPILLDGNVVLCVRSDDPSGRHYDGTLAYLGLYDVALNDTQVALLYSTVNGTAAVAAPSSAAPSGPELPVLSPTTSGSAIASRLSVRGQPCQFPALYNGELVTDCVAIQGVPQCQVAEDVWEECADMGAGTGSGGAEATAAWRYTVDDEECIFPATYAGNVITDCTLLQPEGPKECQTATGAWKECAPVTPATGTNLSSTSGGSADISGDSPVIITDNGSQCQLPLRYSGMKVEGCVNINGTYQCWGMETDSWEACPADVLRKQPEGAELGVDAATVVLPLVPSISRQTTTGEPCQLPVVYQGEILDDCIQRNGSWACLSTSSPGDWQLCDLGSSPQPTNAQGQLLVAQRTATSGATCLLPAVFHGYLSFDCLDYTDAQTGTVEICPTQASAWERCSSPAFSSQGLPEPMPFSAATALNRTAPGRLGMLCPVVPSDEPAQNCAANLTCAPLPKLNPNVTTQLDGLSFCADEPEGGTFGVLEYLQEAQVPMPLAYFPLTGGDLDSLLLPAYRGSLSGAPLPTWVNDSNFGSVLNCSKDGQSAAILDRVPYALTGSFAVSIWMRRLPGSNTSGELFQYLYSHTGLAYASSVGQTPNKVALYLPDRGHPAYGLVRAIVSDANDTGSFGAEPTYLDSDGQLNSNSRNRTPKHADVNDGGWHMVTLSTFANHTRGYALFVDGKQVASLSPSTQLVNGSTAQVTGSDPARLSDTITLCARSDLDPDRFYDGGVAHLMLFNDALSPDTVAGLYSTYHQNTTNATVPSCNVSCNEGAPLVTAAEGSTDAATAAADPGASGDSGLTAGEIAGITLACIGAAMAAVTGFVLLVASHRKRSQGKRFERFNDEAFASTAFQNAEAGTPAPEAARGSGLVASLAAVTCPNIQLSSGKSLSSNGKDLDAELVAAAGPASSQRLYPALSDVSTRAPSTVGGHEVGDTDDTASMASARSRMTDSVAIEPGKHGLLKRGNARVVLPGVEEADPRTPYEP